jgi:hypothetical protein
MATYKGVVPSGKYTFNAAAKTITFDADYTGIALSDIMLITNVKSGTAITIYDPFDPAKGGSLSTLTLTLNYNTTSMSNSDPLQVIVGMVNLPTSLPTGAATETTLSAINTKTPSLGQALAASSVPVVLTAAQLTTLTPLSSISVSNFPATQPISGSISNTSFGISGTLPAFTSTPTFNIGTISTIATESTLSTLSGKIPSGLTVSSTRLLVDGSGGTFPVSGSISVSNFPATQPVSGSVSVSNFPATQPISGTVTANISGSISNTSFAATQATASSLNATVVGTGTFAVQAAQSGTWNVTNISGTVSLPTGAATSAKQPALGTAGTASSDVITVQGIASMTALKVDGSAFTQPVSITAGQTVTVTQTNPVSLKTQAENYQGGTAVSTSNPLQVTLANTGVNSTALKVDGSAVTQPVSGSVTVSGTITANAGTNLNTSALALESGGNLSSIKTNTDNLALTLGSTTSGQKGNLILGAVTTSNPTYTTGNSNPLSVTTAGELRVGSDGCTAYQVVSASSTNLVLIKAGSTKVYGWYIYNNSTAIKKVTLYDSATSGAITVGGTNPLITLVIPATSGANVSLPIPLAVTNGLCIAMTGGAVGSTTMQNSDTTAVTANDLNVNILYK